MIYGLYQSAAGVMTNSYRQDVIANNIANAETTGFKKHMAVFKERPTAAEERHLPSSHTNQMLEGLGGGIFAYPTQVDLSQGELEPTGSNLDAAIEGRGFFTVSDKGETRLTRDGHFAVDRDNHLVMASGEGKQILSADGAPIVLRPNQQITINRFGLISQDEKVVAKLGVVDVANPEALTKLGGTLMSVPAGEPLLPATGSIHGQFVERSNVEPATELTELMDAERQLEANANMIRYQDSTLSRLVNDVAKLS